MFRKLLRFLFPAPVSERYERYTTLKPTLIRVCAWCTPNVGGKNVTHTICESCSLNLLNEQK